MISPLGGVVGVGGLHLPPRGVKAEGVLYHLPNVSSMKQTIKRGEKMIDTVRLKSPAIPEFLAEIVQLELTKKQAIDLSTGELIYQITSGFLTGSFDNRIMIRVYQEPEFQSWHILIEGSIHKALKGHNIFDGETNFHTACQFFIDLISFLLEVTLPIYLEWEVKRVDIANCFQFQKTENHSTLEIIQEWFRGMNTCHYPRRKVIKYDLHGIFFPGTTTATKFYYKGLEFWKNCFKTVKNNISEARAMELQEIANTILRVEVGIKIKKLQYDFNKKIILVSDITTQYLEGIYDSEITKILKAGEKMEIVKSAQAVEARLFSLYPTITAGTLLGTWSRLALFGENYCKNSINRVTFWRHKKLLIQAGISWLCTDVILQDFAVVPIDFKPLRSDCRRLVSQTDVYKIAS